VHLGSGYDWGHGNKGADRIFGGENGQTNRDQLFGLGGSDKLYDNTGPDSDLLCGGDNADRLESSDGDNDDDLIGEGGSDTLIDGGDGDNKVQDGVCV